MGVLLFRKGISMLSVYTDVDVRAAAGTSKIYTYPDAYDDAQ